MQSTLVATAVIAKRAAREYRVSNFVLLFPASLPPQFGLQVQGSEFTRGWAKQWDTNDPQFRHTVLYAGELEYAEGDPWPRSLSSILAGAVQSCAQAGVVSWNNHSGHYTPAAADHVRVHLDPATFVVARKALMIMSHSRGRQELLGWKQAQIPGSLRRLTSDDWFACGNVCGPKSALPPSIAVLHGACS